MPSPKTARSTRRTEADKARVAGFGDVAKPGGPAIVSKRDWIVVTTEDKSGSGLRLGVARPVGDSLANLRRAAARNAGLGLLFIAVALVGIVPLSAHLTRNLSALSEGVRRIAQGDYHARVPVKSTDEVGQLARAFNQMATDVERHEKTAVEQERIRRELELGRQIQSEMLPHAPLNLGLTQVQGVSVPAREVGGDFFNYFVLDDGQIALLMGDVSGKGVGAALLMANIQASLKIRLGLGQNLAAVVDALDRDIEAGSPGSVYATLFIGILDPVRRVLRYVNAGHNPQYALRRTGGLERMHATGFPVGLIAGHGYTELSVQLAAGDLLFFYTDGCVEAENEQGEMFGVERLEPMLLEAVTSADPLQTHRARDGGIPRHVGAARRCDVDDGEGGMRVGEGGMTVKVTHSLQQTVCLLARTPGTLNALLRDLPDEWTQRNEGAGTWSAFDIVGHLIHGERTDWMVRVNALLQFGPAHTFESFDRTGHMRDAQERPLGHLLNEFAQARSENLRELHALNLQPEDLGRQARHPAFGPVTLSQLLATWAAHDLTHLHQISRVMAYQYRDAVGHGKSTLASCTATPTARINGSHGHGITRIIASFRAP